jgi:hypothetical protein
MLSIPIDIVNYICKLAAGTDKLWYPFFYPKTEKVSWKVNPYCIKFKISSTKFLNPIREEILDFHNSKSGESIETKCRMIIFDQFDYCVKKIYIEFDSEDDPEHDNYGRFMFRALLKTLNGMVKSNDSIYVNGTEYATIDFGWITNSDFRTTICYETY